MPDDIMTIIYPNTEREFKDKGTDSRTKAIRDTCSRYNIKCRFVEDRDALVNKDTVSDPFIFWSSNFNWCLSLAESFPDKRKISHVETDVNIPDVSFVLHSLESYSQKVFEYFYAAERRNVAILGVDKNSIYVKTFLNSLLENAEKLGFCITKDDIYWNEKSLAVCTEKFKQNAGKYNAVVCVNDGTAVFLCKEALKIGLRIPEELYVIGRGDITIGRMTVPSITTSGFNEAEIGRQTVYLYRYLKKHKEIKKATVIIDQDLLIRGSTGFFQPKKLPSIYTAGNALDYVALPMGFEEITKINELLKECDKTDFGILYGIMSGTSNLKMAEELFVAPSTVTYKINNMMKALRVKSKKELVNLLKEYNIR